MPTLLLLLLPLLPCCLQAGMSSINDFATTYMCQSLPFGGVKHSGFDRFAGIEGLRGMTVPKARAQHVPLHRIVLLLAPAPPLSLPPIALAAVLSAGPASLLFPNPPSPSEAAHIPLCISPPLHSLRLLQAVAEDRWPFKTAIPPLLQYPVSDRAFDFVSSLVWMFYAPGWAGGYQAIHVLWVEWIVCLPCLPTCLVLPCLPTCLVWISVCLSRARVW